MVIPITQVAKGIFRVGPLDTGHASAPTTPYIVVGSQRTAIVEPGEDGQAPGLLEAVKLCDLPLSHVAYIVPTHIHMHHIQGAPLLLKQLPQAKFVVHPRGAPHVIEPARLVQSTIEAWGDKCYGTFSAIPKEKVMTVEDGQVLDLGDTGLEFIYAPGHAPHHMGVFDRRTRALFMGDTVSLGGPARERGYHDIRPPLFDVDKFIQTGRRFMALKPSMLLSFALNGASLAPDKTLKWAEEDILAIERICRDGMKRKMSFKEIVRQVEDFEDSLGSRTRDQRRSGPEFNSGGLYGMLAYIHRKDPSLEIPADATQRM